MLFLIFVALSVVPIVVDCFKLQSIALQSSGCAFQSRCPRSNAKVRMQSEIVELQQSLFSDIENTLGLKRTDFTDFEQVTTWSNGGINGCTDWYDEASGAKLTGVAKYSCSDSYETSCSIDGWVGPSSPVPHMTLSLLRDEGTGMYGIISDFIPRGSTPIGNDQRYLDLHYNEEVIMSRYRSVAEKPGVLHLPPPLCFSGRLLRSPLHLAVTGLSFEDMSDAAYGHVQQWLAWLDSAEEVQARMRGAMNMRDDRLREFAYRAALNRYMFLLQSEGDGNADIARRVAAGSTGPLAEAYVGGGS